jgi:hypothetical protein
MIHMECADGIAEKVCLCHPENPSEVLSQIPEFLPPIEIPIIMADSDRTFNIFHAENLRLNTGPPLPSLHGNPFEE